MIYYATRYAAAHTLRERYQGFDICSYRDLTEAMRFSGRLAVITLPRAYAVHRVLSDGRLGSHIETIRWMEEARHGYAA